MSKGSIYLLAWLVLICTVVAAGTIVIIPAWLIQPFAPQTEKALALSFALRRWSPLATIILTAMTFLQAVLIWNLSRRWFAKVALVFPLFFVVVFTWFARQNHFEWMFNPLADAGYVRANSVDFIEDDDMVLAVKLNGESVAYPIRQMAYHHVVQDVVGGMPITATY
jgi:Protein of unknown function (DUF3179).